MRPRERNTQSPARRITLRRALVATMLVLAASAAFLTGRDRSREPAAAELVRAPLRAASAHASATTQTTRTVSGRIVDDEGNIVTDAYVALEERVTRVSSGRFSFESVPAGPHSLYAHNDTGAAGPVSIFVDDDTVVTLRLRAGPRVQLHVTDLETGRPIEGARARLILDDATGGRELAGVAASDASGLVRFPVMPLMTGVAYVEATGYAPAAQFVTWNDQSSMRWEVLVALQRGVRLTGSIISSDGRPVAAARISVQLRGAGGSSSTRLPQRSGSSGEFALTVPPKTPFSISVHHDDFVPLTKALPVAALIDASDLSLVLDRGISIRGRVVLPDGSPVANAIVGEHADDQSTESKRASTGSDGEFTIHGLPPDEPVFLIARTAQRRSNRQRVDLQDKRPVEIVMEHELSIRGTVLHDDGTPVADARVFFTRHLANEAPSSGEAGGSGETRTSEDGSFHLGGLAEGTYELTAQIPRSRDSAGIVMPQFTSVPAEAGDQQVVLIAPRSSSISGRVVNASGSALERFEVSLAFVSGRTEVRSADGSFALHGINPELGSYVLRVEAEGHVPAEVTVAVTSGEDSSVGMVVLEHGELVRGIVVGSEGQPIAGADILGRSDSAAAWEPLARSDVRGEFSATVPVIPVAVQAVAPTVGASAVRRSAISGATMMFTVPQTGHLEVAVRGERPDAPVHVVAVASGAPRGIPVTTSLQRSADGATFAADLAPARYDIYVDYSRWMVRPEARVADANVSIQADAVERVAVAAPPIATSEPTAP